MLLLQCFLIRSIILEFKKLNNLNRLLPDWIIEMSGGICFYIRDLFHTSSYS